MVIQKRRNSAERRRASGIVHKTSMAQSAVEYLSVYGFAILVIAIIAVVLYFFVSAPSNVSQTQCSFTSNINCKQIVIGSNSIATKAVFLFSDSQQYAMKNPSITVNVTNIGTFAGSCTPSFILPGGTFECVVNANNKVTPNQLASGQIFISATICTQPTESGCGSPVSQVFGGTFTTHVSPLVPPPQCSISFTVKNSTQLATGAGDELIANVKLFNTNIAGATVNFTSNSPTSLISQQYVNTNANGNAISYVSSTTGGTMSNIIAKFGNCTGSVNVGFIAPVYITFASNVHSGSSLLTIGGSSYTTLPVRLPVLAGSPISYSYGSTVQISSGYRYANPTVSGSSGCSVSPGAVTASSNCTVTGNFIQQYLLTMNPGSCGQITPNANQWVNSGNQPTIDAIPSISCQFNGWQCTGACSAGDSSSSSGNLLVLTPVSGALTENAMFTPQEQLTLNNNGCSSVSGSPSSGNGYYAYGIQVIISATVPSGDFVVWTGNAYSGSSASNTIIMNGPVTETATCTTPILFSLGVQVSSASAGTTNSPYTAPGTYTVLGGNVVSLAAIPSPGYAFTGWTCTPKDTVSTCPSQDTESSSNVITLAAMSGNIIETANFLYYPYVYGAYMGVVLSATHSGADAYIYNSLYTSSGSVTNSIAVKMGSSSYNYLLCGSALGNCAVSIAPVGNSNKIYITSSGEGTYETTLGSSSATEVTTLPDYLVTTDNNGYAYMAGPWYEGTEADLYGTVISVVNGGTDQITSNIFFNWYDGVEGMGISPDGSTLVVEDCIQSSPPWTYAGDLALYIYKNPSTFTLSEQLGPGANAAQSTPNVILDTYGYACTAPSSNLGAFYPLIGQVAFSDGYAYVINNEAIDKVNLTTDTVVDVIYTGSGYPFESIATSPDGKYLAAIYQQGSGYGYYGGMYIISTATDTITQSSGLIGPTGDYFNPYSVTFTPDGKYVVLGLTGGLGGSSYATLLEENTTNPDFSNFNDNPRSFWISAPGLQGSYPSQTSLYIP